MIDWLESQPYSNIPDLEQFVHCVQRHENDFVYEEWNRAIGRNAVKHLNSWSIDLSQKRFAQGGINSLDGDATFQHCQIHDAPEVKMWRATAKQFISLYPNALDENGKTKEHMFTKLYRIKPVEPGRTKGKLLIA